MRCLLAMALLGGGGCKRPYRGVDEGKWRRDGA